MHEYEWLASTDGQVGPCMVAPVPIQSMNVCEWVNVIRSVKSALSSLKTRKALYKYSPFTIYHCINGGYNCVLLES